MNEHLARLLFGLFFIAFVAVRLFYHWKAGAFAKRHPTAREHVFVRRLRMITPLWFVLALVYLLAPSTVASAQMTLPDAVRWLGFLLLYVSLALITWINFSLGRNFSGMLVLQDDHVLIQHGPYRRVRHPMYPTFLLMSMGMFLLTGHALIGVPVFLGVTMVMLVRTPQEEAMMLERFGDEYRRYMSVTGRYLPRLGALPRRKA